MTQGVLAHFPDAHRDHKAHKRQNGDALLQRLAISEPHLKLPHPLQVERVLLEFHPRPRAQLRFLAQRPLLRLLRERPVAVSTPDHSPRRLPEVPREHPGPLLVLRACCPGASAALPVAVRSNSPK